MSKTVLPEGLIANYTHIRWVVIDTFVTIHGVDVSVSSRPLLMQRHEWQRAREEDHKARVLPGGGLTVCRLYKEVDGQPDKLVSTSLVECTKNDNYVKARGRAISLGRALKKVMSS